MWLPSLAILGGLLLLVWSADRFIDGAAAAARHFGMPSLLIGIVVIGFGTSAPELAISAISALNGSPGLALGNAYGSNIANIGLILGLTALLMPIAVQSGILRKELPLLLGATLLAGVQLLDGEISRLDAVVLLVAFLALMGWMVWQGLQQRDDALGSEVEQELTEQSMPLPKALFWLALGLVLLIVSSRILVWGAVEIASALGVSDLIIGLTIVAIGTSLPELASSIIAVRKGEQDLALGNVIGSNLFNVLAVVGVAGLIMPMPVPHEILWRDWLVMFGFTLALFIFSYGFRAAGRINRLEGGVLLGGFAAYLGYLALSTLGA